MQRVARVRSTNMRTYRANQAIRIVGKIEIVTLSQFRIVAMRSLYKWGATSPSSHDLCGQQLRIHLAAGLVRLIVEPICEACDILFQLPKNQVCSVEAKTFLSRVIGCIRKQSAVISGVNDARTL